MARMEEAMSPEEVCRKSGGAPFLVLEGLTQNNSKYLYSLISVCRKV